MAWTFLKGQPLVTKLSWLSLRVVLPGAMAAALYYSPPEFRYRKKLRKKQAESSSSTN